MRAKYREKVRSLFAVFWARVNFLIKTKTKKKRQKGKKKKRQKEGQKNVRAKYREGVGLG